MPTSMGSYLFRRLISTTPISVPVNPPISCPELNNPDLYKRLSSVLSTGEKVSEVLDQILSNSNNQLQREDLVQCIRILRMYGHYQLCLEILEWMEKLRIGHSAYRLNMICEVKGVDEAENYFDSLPFNERNRATYGALLDGYCSKKMTDKALALFKKMDDMVLVLNEMPYLSLMGLYMIVDLSEKVPPLIQEMKQRKIPLTSMCYRYWIQSYASLKDREGIERVVEEVRQQISLKDEWLIYVCLASAYAKTDQHEKIEQAAIMLEENVDHSFDNPHNVGYHYLINLYAKSGNLESVNRVWEKLKMNSDFCDNACYLSMLHALSILGNMKLLLKYFIEWLLNHKSYDTRILDVVIAAFLRHGWFKVADLILKDATEKGGKKACAANINYMSYYLKKREIDSALKHLEVALANYRHWHSFSKKFNKFFEFFIEEKDVDGAEHVCRMLERSLPLDSTTYLWLLQTYVAAGKTSPEMRQRMERSGIDIGTEHEVLLEKVCPN